MRYGAFALILGLMLVVGCGKGEDLKKQVEQKNQVIATKDTEIKKLQDDLAAREADLKSQCEQRLQKAVAQNKQQVDALNAKVAELNKKLQAADKTQKSQKADTAKRSTSKSRR